MSSLSLPTLPQLHTLTLVLPLEGDEVAPVLAACPAVEDVCLNVRVHERCTAVPPLEQLEMVGSACSKVVTRVFITSANALKEAAAADANTASASNTASSPALLLLLFR